MAKETHVFYKKNSDKNKKADKKQKPTSDNKEKKYTMNPIENCLKLYFEQEAKRDAAFAKKYSEGKKTVHQAFQYLYEHHRPGTRKNGDCAATDNTEDNLLAKKFIMDDSIPAETPSQSGKGKTSKPAPKKPEPKDDIDLDIDDIEMSEDNDSEEELDCFDLDGFDDEAKPKAKPAAKPKVSVKPSAPKSKPTPKEQTKPQPKQFTVQFGDELDDFDF